jgi:tRNA A-37 threonylcarbamoyl transferase component Bud32
MGTRATAGAGRPERVALPGRYESLHHIANGGMASVWRATDVLLGRTVAIKLLAESYLVDETAIRRFEREARTAARVSAHPHVVTIYDVGVASPQPADGVDEPSPYIVMEYLPGGSVADALRAAGGAGIDPRLAVRWVHEAAAGLDHAHSLGVVHRDVKPGNLLLDRAQRLHVADFGIARLVSEATITNVGEVLGTAAYLSPEQALGHPATAASDRYSLAVAAYELLTGSRPFDGEAVLARLDPDGEHAPEPASQRNPSLPSAVDAVLARGMSRSPVRRWGSASEFATALDHALSAPAALRFADTARYTPFVAHSSRSRFASLPAVALAVLAASALAAGIAAGAGSGGNAPRAGAGAGAKARHGQLLSSRTPARRHRPRPPQTAPSTKHNGASTQPPPTQTPTQLDASGHQMMLQGDYTGAIGAMRAVLAATPADSLLHAWALFDLGHSLRLSGDPQAAIPVLEQRLQFPNQTSVVQAELALAERAAGIAPAGGPGGSAKHGRHGHGPGGDGGAGLGGGPSGGGGGD